MNRYEDQSTGVVWYAFPEPGDGFTHAMITRVGGVSQGAFSALNLGHTVGDDPEAVRENHHRVNRTFNIKPARVVSPYQVHQRRVTRVTADDGGTIIPATDALITNTAGLTLLLRFADCVPVLFYDPVHHAAGLAHAGWRGIAAGVLPACVQAMMREFDANPSTLWAGIGPAICQQHYQVNLDVIDALRAAVPPAADIAAIHEGHWTADLPGAVDAQLRSLKLENVHHANLCTACRNDDWYSHRAEAGKTGRFGVLVRLD